MSKSYSSTTLYILKVVGANETYEDVESISVGNSGDMKLTDKYGDIIAILAAGTWAKVTPVLDPQPVG